MNHIPNGLSRRSVLGVAAGSALTAMLAACSNDSSSSKSSTSGTAASGAAAGAKFPQTVKSVYGNVTVQDQPKRVVALFSATADICVALGVQPVAVAGDGELGSWYHGRFTGAMDKGLESSGPSVERIASYKPDLIVGNSYSVPEDQYAKVGKVAPTYCGRHAGTEDWRNVVEDLSLLLTGSAAKGEAAKAHVAAEMAPYKSRIKGLQGKTYAAIAISTDQITFANATALGEIGLVPASNQDGASQTTLSWENMKELTADVLAVTGDEAASKKMREDPRFAQLPAVKNGTVLWWGESLDAAMTLSSPSTFKVIAEWATPLLEKSKLNTQG